MALMWMPLPNHIIGRMVAYCLSAVQVVDDLRAQHGLVGAVGRRGDLKPQPLQVPPHNLGGGVFVDVIQTPSSMPTMAHPFHREGLEFGPDAPVANHSHDMRRPWGPAPRQPPPTSPAVRSGG